MALLVPFAEQLVSMDVELSNGGAGLAFENLLPCLTKLREVSLKGKIM